MLSYDIFEVDSVIEKEGIKEVTSPKLFLSGIDPDPEGLASYEIFGVPGSEARKKQYGFIRLNCTVIHPHVLFELKQVKRLFHDVAYGLKRAYIKDGWIEEYNEEEDKDLKVEHGTGISFLKENWKRFNFDPTGTTGARFNRMRFLKTMTEKQVFFDKILVLPAFYRDVDMRAGAKKNEWEGFYVKLINLASTISTTTDFLSVVTENTMTDIHRNIQTTIVELYDHVIGMIGGRKGFIHKFVMAKNVDFSARLVISGANSIDAYKPSDMTTSFDTSAVPLHVVSKCFAPFMINRIRYIINEYMAGQDFVVQFENGNSYFPKNASEMIASARVQKKEEPSYKVVELASDWRTVLSSKSINKLIDIYHESQEHRLDVYKLPLANGDHTVVHMDVVDIGETVVDSMTDISVYQKYMVPLRLIHLFYIAAMEIIQDKHILITRFPIQDQNNTYPSKINVMAYKNTKRLLIGDTVYDNFPVVNYEKDINQINAMFSDSLSISGSYLSALGADFDGDMLSIIPIFTKEANADAAKFIRSKANMCSMSGGTIKPLGKIYQQAIYGLTA